MDPLSDVLSLLKPLNYMSSGFDTAGDWSISFPGQAHTIKCGAVVKGSCWLAVEGAAEPVLLQSGDGFMLPHGRPFIFSSDPALESTIGKNIFGAARNGGIVMHNGGGECFLISSRFSLEGEHADLLLTLLPPLVHIRKTAAKEAIRHCIEQIMQELREPQPGAALNLEHLAHMLLIQALRLHLAEGLHSNTGWLFALADKQIGAAISIMHANPAQRWTIQELAQQVGMSRSGFAQKFKQVVGTSPIDYLTQWRMRLAGDQLRHSSQPVSAIALTLGYESESAFSTAFKRVMGCSPRQYAKVLPQ